MGRAKGDDISRAITKRAARAAVSADSFVCRFFGSESPQPFKGAVDSCLPCLTLCCHQIGASLAQRQARGLEALPLWLSVRLLWAYWPATMRLMWAAYRRCVTICDYSHKITCINFVVLTGRRSVRQCGALSHCVPIRTLVTLSKGEGAF